MSKKNRSLIILGIFSMLLTSCNFMKLGNYHIVSYNTAQPKEKYTVHFHSMGGNEFGTVKIDIDKNIDFDKYTPVRANHKFLGWSSTEDRQYYSESSFNPTTGTSQREFDYYAAWDWDYTMKYVYMGEYPKRVVHDSDVIAALNAVEPRHQDGQSYDITYQGAKYRKIQSRNDFTYSLVQGKTTPTVVGDWLWFKYAPLKWSKTGDGSLIQTDLCSLTVIDAMAMNEVGSVAVTETSLYSWLNSDLKSNYFYDQEYVGMTSGLSLPTESNQFTINYDEYASFNNDYARAMGFGTKIWLGSKLGELYQAYDLSTKLTSWVDSTEILGIVPRIVKYDSRERVSTTVTFDSDGGTPIEPKHYYFPDGVSIEYDLPIPTKESVWNGDNVIKYTFDGWNNTASLVINQHIYKYSTSMGDVHFKARYLSDSKTHYCQIHYVLPEYAFNDERNPTQIRPTQTVYLYMPTFQYGTFDAWYFDIEYTQKVNALSGIKDDEITIYAKFDLYVYQIEYYLQADDAVNDPDNPTSYTFNTGYVTLKDPSRPNYAFDYWTANSSSGAVLENNTIHLFSGKMKLYAHWKLIQYTITYHISHEPIDQESWYSQTVTGLSYDHTTHDFFKMYYWNTTYFTYGDLPKPTALKYQHTFVGWALPNGELINNEMDIVPGTYTLTATFEYTG